MGEAGYSCARKFGMALKKIIEEWYGDKGAGAITPLPGGDLDITIWVGIPEAKEFSTIKKGLSREEYLAACERYKDVEELANWLADYLMHF